MKNKSKNYKRNDKLFLLYKKVMNKDRDAEDELVRLYNEKFKNATFCNFLVRGDSNYRENLHTAYIHLTTFKGKL